MTAMRKRISAAIFAIALAFSGSPQLLHATNYTVNSGTGITATVPTGAVTGKITVKTPGGSAASKAIFTVTP